MDDNNYFLYDNLGSEQLQPISRDPYQRPNDVAKQSGPNNLSTSNPNIPNNPTNANNPNNPNNPNNNARNNNNNARNNLNNLNNGRNNLSGQNYQDENNQDFNKLEEIGWDYNIFIVCGLVLCLLIIICKYKKN